MEITVLEQTKNRLRIQLTGVGHSFCNALKDELWNEKNVEVAAYSIRHPLTGVPELLVETKGAESPVSALTKAAKKLVKINEKTSKDLLNELK